MDLSLDRRIDRLEARAAISDMCTNYCTACDDHDLVLLESLFAPDARVHSRDKAMDADGRENVMAMFRKLFSIRGPAYHWTHDRTITFSDEDPDVATGLLLAHAETTPNGVASIAGIRYHDRYRRIDGKWLFAERFLTFLYYMPMKDFLTHFPTDKRMGLGGEWRAADFPEGLPNWPYRV